MKNYFIAFFAVFSLSAHANFGLENISKTDLENVVRELSGNFHHTTVTGASSEGTIFGFQVGLVGGLYASPEMEKLFTEAGESGGDQLAHAALMGVLSVPFGITGEINILPTTEIEGGEFKHTSLAVKWTLTDTVLELPVDLAIRASVSQTKLDFSQVVSGATTNTKFDSSITGLSLLVGKKLLIVNPYFGLGFVKADGELGFTGSQTIFDNNFTTGTSASVEETSTHIFAGAEVNLLILKAGLEVAQVFDNRKVTAKVAFGF